jgi:hypothetical protein
MSTIPLVIIKTIIAVLKKPVKVGDLITYAKAVYKAMKANALFAASLATLAELETAITALYDAETGHKQKPPTVSTEARNAAKTAVNKLLNTLRDDVQKVADDDPPNAEAIIVAAAMFVKKSSARGKQKNTAENGNEPGTVVLTAEGKGGHEWRMSQDDENWIPLEYTGTSKTVVKGLKSGEIYYFQNRKVYTKGVKSEWSQSIKIRVN